MNINAIIGILIITWTLAAPVYYLWVNSKIKQPTKKFVLFLISGPFIWVGLPLFFVLEKLSEKVFEPLHNWLTKE